MAVSKYPKTLNIKNRRARFDYELLDTFVAGMVLQGTEIKSIRQGKASLQEAYCIVVNGELFIKSMHINTYLQGSYNNHETLRERKLLLSKRELRKIEKEAKVTGISIVPTRLFISDRGYAKVEIALARGKKSHDKRDSIKKRDTEREVGRKL